MSSAKERRELCHKLEKQGCTITRAKRGGHIKVYKDNRLVTTMPSSSTSASGLRNQIAFLRRAGFTV